MGSPTRARSLARSRRARVGAACAAAAVLLHLGPFAAVAAGRPDTATVTASGTVMHVAVETGHEGAHDDTEPGHDDTETMRIESLVDVDGTLVELPAELSPAGSVTGDEVTVTIEAESGMTSAAAVEAASGHSTGTARVVDVEPVVTDVAAPSGEPDAGGEPTGTPTLEAVAPDLRTLTVLPAHWGSPDSATRTSLQALAATTAQYWSEQSSGAVAIQHDVRDWKQMAGSKTCDMGLIWQRALEAHGVASPGVGEHVAVYFPRRSDCGAWAGMASVGGGAIWINGSQAVDVLAHEFGHNLGLGHANLATCTSSGVRVPLALPLTSSCDLAHYGDTADVMGYAGSQASGNINTGFADHLGFATVSRPLAGTTTTVDLSPLSSTRELRSIALPADGGTVYVDFRPAVGRDVRMPAWAGVQVHYRTMDPEYGYPTTYLLDMAPETSTPFTSPAMPAGRSWAIPGTSQVLSVVDVGDDLARVSVLPESSVVPGGALYVPVTPARLHDARGGVAPETVTCVGVAGYGGVPLGASGVALNVATVQPAGPGHVVVFPDPGTTAPSAAPGTATVNFAPGKDVANAAMVALPGNGRVCYLIRGARAGIVVDVTGYTTAGSGIEMRTPERLHDLSGVGPAEPVTVQVAGHGGVPAGARAVLLNVAAAGSAAPGNLRLHAAGTPRPNTSTLNFASPGDKSNAAIVELSSGGALTYVTETAPTNRVRVILDVVGYTVDGVTYVPVPPVRLVDTRVTGALGAGERIAVPVADSVGVPADASAVVLNAVGVGPTTVGNLRVFPFRSGSTAVPSASTLNYIAGSDVANMVVTGIGDDRRVVFYTDQPSGGRTHVVADVVGYLTSAP